MKKNTTKDSILKRNQNIMVRFTETEYDLIKHNAAHAGLSLSAYVRKLALGGKVEPRYFLSPQITDMVPILSQLGKIGSNLNQISRYFNSGGDSTDDIKRKLRQCMAKLLSLRSELAQLTHPLRTN